MIAFPNPSSGATYSVFLKILKLHATLTFQIKTRNLDMNDDIIVIVMGLELEY